MAIAELVIKDIEGIYAGETFSRKVELKIDGVVQEPATYTLAASLYALSNSNTPLFDTTTTPASGDNISADSSTITIPASLTANMLGLFIVKVTFNIAGYITIRKAQFKVEA